MPAPNPFSATLTIKKLAPGRQMPPESRNVSRSRRRLRHHYERVHDWSLDAGPLDGRKEVYQAGPGQGLEADFILGKGVCCLWRAFRTVLVYDRAYQGQRGRRQFVCSWVSDQHRTRCGCHAGQGVAGLGGWRRGYVLLVL
jgi:hypothetical protein